ncbi:MAG: SDR family oxidoreductase [Desulfobacterales bacterium]|nr:SDR family oxidoreductase [Desulfobacterales bacterium]
MMNIFEDKVALVTGAASGIGKALSQELAARGAKVIAADVNEEMLQQAIAGIMGTKFPVQGFKLDVTNHETFKKVIEDTAAKEGKLDYLFNNAGIAIAGEIRDLSVEDWMKVLDVNLNGVVYGSIEAYKIMVKQGFGHIINLSSIEGMTAFPATSSYVTSKFAVLGLSKCLWLEGSDLGVKVSVICPGFIRTPIFDVSPVVNIDREEMLKSLAPFEKFSISPEECARRILKGVSKNKLIIPVTGLAWVLWWLVRISPKLVLKLTRMDFRKIRDKARINS